MRLYPSRLAQALASVYGYQRPFAAAAFSTVPCPGCLPPPFKRMTTCPLCGGRRSVFVVP